MYSSPKIIRLTFFLVLVIAGCNDGVSGNDGGPGRDAKVVAEETEALCTDGLDNDGDGFADCKDQACWDFTVCAGDGGPRGEGATIDDRGVLVCSGVGCGTGETCVDGKCVAAGPTKKCGAEPFGDTAALPANDRTVYVWAGYAGSTKSDGTKDAPFKTIGEALAEIPGGKKYTVVVGDGIYDEELTIGDRSGEKFSADLYCRCPDKVRIAQPLRIVQNGALEVTLDGCTVSPKGFDLAQATDWVDCSVEQKHGVSATGTASVHSDDPFHILLKDSVVAGWYTGVYFLANSKPIGYASICIAHSRLSANIVGFDAHSTPLNHNGSPFTECQRGADSENVAIVESLIDQNRDYGVRTRSAARGIMLLGNIVERTGQLGDTIAPFPDGGVANGDGTDASDGGGPSTAEPSFGFGVYLGDTESAMLTHNLVRHNHNRGIGLRNEEATPSDAFAIALQNNVLEGNRSAGIALQKMRAQLIILVEGNIVRDTEHALSGELGGDGIQISIDEGEAYAVSVQGNVVSNSERHGLFYDGAFGAVEHNSVIDSGNYGCLLQQSAATVGENTWSGNLEGDVHNSNDPSSPLEKYGSLPIPLP